MRRFLALSLLIVTPAAAEQPLDKFDAGAWVLPAEDQMWIDAFEREKQGELWRAYRYRRALRKARARAAKRHITARRNAAIAAQAAAMRQNARSAIKGRIATARAAQMGVYRKIARDLRGH